MELNHGLGKQNLSIVFVTIMMFAFLADQIQQMSCPLFCPVRKKSGSKSNLCEKIPFVFHLIAVSSMEMLYFVISRFTCL